MYLIGVDGGGTKTESIIAKENEEIISFGESGSANIRNVGIDNATSNIAKAIEDSFTKMKTEGKIEVASIFIGIPSFAEEYRDREGEIRDEIFKKITLFLVQKERIFIDSDQRVAFRAGTDKRDGVVVIAGTGSVVRGWNKKREHKSCGWGYLAEVTGAFRVGQRAYQEVAKALDGRREKTLLTEVFLNFFGVKDIIELNKIVYSKNPIDIISPASLVVSEAAEKGDSVARDILNDASRELAIATKNTIDNLDFREDFPLVLSGGMFKSDIFLENFKREVLKDVSSAKIILLKEKPTVGAIKLAKEAIINL